MEIIKNSKKIIVAMLVIIMIMATSPIILGANDGVAPVITPEQNSGEILAGQNLKFKVTDDTTVSYIFYAWDRHISNVEVEEHIYELEKEESEYEYTITAPKTLGLHELSIAAQDHYGNISYWLNIPYIVVNKLSGVADNVRPKLVFNIPKEYPYNDSTIEQGMKITVRATDNQSGIYYIGYKWTRQIVQNDTTQNLVFKDNAEITAPSESGTWYLITYARDGANNVSSAYATRVYIKETDYTELREKVNNLPKLVEEDYTSESWKQLQDVIAETNKMIADNKSTQKQVDEQITKVENAINNSLVAKPIDRTELTNYIEPLVSTDYSNWANFTSLVEAANAETIKLQSEFDKKVEEVKAFDLKAKEINTAELDKIEADLAKLTESDYTSDSWNAIQDKIEEAKKQTLQSKFDEIVNEIKLDTLVELPKILNIDNSARYAKVGDTITIPFETNMGLRIGGPYTDKSSVEINGNKATIQAILGEQNKYTITYTVTSEDVNANNGSLSYAIKLVSSNNVERKEIVTGTIDISDYITGITITKPTNTEYKIDEPINLDGGKITLTMASRNTEDINMLDENGKINKNIKIEGFDTSSATKAGEKITVKVSYEGYEGEPATFEITVAKKDITKDIIASEIKVVPPSEPVTYDGTSKEVKIDIDALAGMGKVTSIKYEKDGTTLTELPKDAGEYTVRISIGEGEKYKARSNFAVGTLTIEKATPTYTVPTELTAIYGKTLADVELPEGFTFEIEEGKELSDISVGTVAGPNAFTVTYTPKDTNNYNVVTKIPVTVRVEKAGPEYTAPTGLTAVYGQTLANVELPEGFAFQDDLTTLVGNAGPNTFKVTYTPDDTDNYNLVENIAVTIEVARATAPTITFPTASKITYGQTLADSELVGGSTEYGTFAWHDSSAVPVAGTSRYTVVFTPNKDTIDNYEPITTTSSKVEIEVEKATPVDGEDYEVPTGLTATYGETLADVELPEGFTFEIEEGKELSDISVGTVAGPNKFTVTYTPDDTNYKAVEDIEVEIEVSQGTPKYEIPTGLTAVYGETLADVELPEGFTFEIEEGKELSDISVGTVVGPNTFTVTYTPSDTNNYKIVQGIEVEITVTKANVLKIKIPTASKITYGQTLANSELTGGSTEYGTFAWVNPSAIPEVNNTEGYKVRFTPKSDVLKNYEKIENEIVRVIVEVEQAIPVDGEDYEVPTGLTATYGETLADVELPKGFTFEIEEGKELSDISVGTVAGPNKFTVTYTPDDTNYKAVEGIEVEITVEQAIPVDGEDYEVPTGLTATYGETLADVELPEGFTFEIEEGKELSDISVGTVAGPNKFTVTYTPKDTDNYNVVENIEIEIEVSKATPVAEKDYTVPTGLTATYGETLADVELPEGFTFKIEEGKELEDIEVGNAGLNKFTVIYTPEDTDNYKEVEIEVEIEVEKIAYILTGVEFNDINAIYDGEGKTVTISTELPKGIKVTYEHNKRTTVGTREATATFTIDTDTIEGQELDKNYNAIQVNETESNVLTAKITITKAIPEEGKDYEIPELTATYGETLADVELPEGFAFEIEEGQELSDISVGTVAGPNKFTITYTPKDTENYNVVENIEVEIEVSQGTPKYEVPTGLTAVYGETLADIELPEGFTFKIEEGKELEDIEVGNAGSNKFTVIYTPEDTDNYKEVEIEVEIEVEKIAYILTGVEFNDINAIYDGELKTVTISSELPKGIKVTYEHNKRTTVGTREATATFTIDTDTIEGQELDKNYNAIQVNETESNVLTAKITITKAIPEEGKDYEVPTGLTATYGETLADVELPEGFTFEIEEGQELSDISVGTVVGLNKFTVTYTPKDTDNYNVVENIEIEIEVSKATPVAGKDYTIPTGLEATYGETLADIELPEGFTFKIEEGKELEDIEVGNAGSNKFTVIYTPEDTDNYKAVEVEVEIEVSKATPVAEKDYTIPTGLEATYGETLADVELPERFAFKDELTTPVGNAGTNTFTVIYTPEDTDNYNVVENIEVTITVEKATQEKPIVSVNNTSVVLHGEPPVITVSNEPKENGKIIYISSDTDVLTINAKGTVSLVGLGKAEIRVRFGATENYNAATSDPIEVTVSMAKLEKEDFVYEIPENGYTYTGREQGIDVNPETVLTGYGDISVSYNKIETTVVDGEEKEIKTPVEGLPVNAGKYEVVLKVEAGDYYAELNAILGTYTITSKEPTVDDLKFDLTTNTKPYTGEEQPITVEAGEGIDGLGGITVKYNGETTAPINAADYTVEAIIEEGTNYTSATIELGTYTITPISIEHASITTKAQDVTDVTYEGEKVKAPEIKSVKVNETILKENIDYRIRAIAYAPCDPSTGNSSGDYISKKPTEAGTYKAKITVEGIGNYAGTKNKYVGIEIKAVDIEDIIDVIQPTGMKEYYKYNEDFDVTGWKIKVKYNNNVQKTISLEQALEDGIMTIDGYDKQTIGKQEVSIKYGDKSKFLYPVTVQDGITEIQVTQPNKIVYKIGDDFETTGMTATAVKASGATVQINNNALTLKGYDLNNAGTYTVTVSYTDGYDKNYTHGDKFTAEFKIVVMSDDESNTENPKDKVMILNGQSAEEVEYGTEYKDAGVSIYNVDNSQLVGDVKSTTKITKVISEENEEKVDKIETTELGAIYKITYELEGANSVTRTVKVVDKIAPEITLVNDKIEGKENISVESNKNETVITFTKGKAIFNLSEIVKAEDTYDGIVDVEYLVTYNSKPVVITEIGEEAGEYVVTYTAKDSSENIAEALVVKFIVLDYPPIIYYVDDEIKIEIEDGKVYNDYLTIKCDKENLTIYIIKDNEEEVEYKGEVLRDGTYTIRGVEGVYISSAERTFTIDTIAPEVEEINAINRTITFTNPSDVYKATLTSGDGSHIIVLKDVKNNINRLDENGIYHITDEDNEASRVYTLRVEDANGNKIRLPEFKLPELKK